MRPLFIGLSIFLFTSSAWGGKFVETFKDGDMEGWQELLWRGAEPGFWEIIDGELHAISLERFTRLLTIGDETWQDYTIEFDVKPLEKHGPGGIAIAARVKKTRTIFCTIGDRFIFGPGPIARCFFRDFDSRQLHFFGVGASPLLALENWSHLKLKADGSTFTLYLNGKQVLETTDEADRLPTGGVGLGLANYTARFDNIVITGKGIPNKGSLSVTSQAKITTTWGQLKQF